MDIRICVWLKVHTAHQINWRPPDNTDGQQIWWVKIEFRSICVRTFSNVIRTMVPAAQVELINLCAN